MALPDFSVKKPVTITMVFLAVIILGTNSLLRLPVELMPNVSLGTISIIIHVRGGMPPEEVEALVTRPVEEAVSTVTHLDNLSSSSKKGESRVVLEFEPGVNMDFAALEVREKFSTVKEKLPKEIEKPVIAQYKQSDYPVILLATTGTYHSPEVLRQIVDADVKERLLRVEGVANVDVFGGQQRKILVEVDQKKLQAYNIPIERVISVLGRSNMNLVAGEVKQTKNKLLIRTIGVFESLEDVRNIGVATTPQGSVIRLKELARVDDSFLEPESYARVDIQPVVSLYIYKESTANTIGVCEGILDELKHIELPEGVKIKTIFNQSTSIKDAIHTVQESLLQGALLAVIILFLFLREIPSTFIIATTIPISVMATFFFMYLSRTLFKQEITLNIMTLSGLALGIGMLVDNSIVVLENIFKLRSDGLSTRKAVVEGTEEVMLAVVASTVTTIVVFLPFIFVNKEIQILWMGLAMTVTYSLVSSLFVAMSLVPMLASRILPPLKEKIKKVRGRFLTFLLRLLDITWIYKKVLIFVLRYKFLIIFDIVLAFLLSVYFLTNKVDKQFTTSSGEGRFTIFVDLDPGAKLDISDHMAKEIEQFLEEIPEIKNFSSHVEAGSSKVYVNLIPRAQRQRETQELIDYIRSKAAAVEKKYKGGFIYFSEIKESGMEEVIVDLYGFDYKILKELAGSISERLSTIQGLQDVRMSRIQGRPEWGVEIVKDRAALYGVTVKEVAETLHAQMRGLRATRYHTEGTEVETVVRLQGEYRDTIDEIRKLTLGTPEGEQVYLEEIAQFVPSLVPGEIIRQNKNRIIHISANCAGISLHGAVEQIREVLKDLPFPKDYYYRIGGDYYKNLERYKQLIFVFVITVLLVYLVLASLFESYVQPFLIMLTVPLAAIGVTIALIKTHTSITQGVMIGSIMLAGIVVNNAIVMVDHINLLRRKGYRLHRAIVVGSQDRLRPIMMTTLTTVLGLVPMAIGKSESSSLWSPLAITVIGGLISSTCLTLFIIPGMYLLFEQFGRLLSNIVAFLFFRKRLKQAAETVS
ncbi:MAG: efflux RND transporter permease subunit [Candidatus Omnitrophica bacterium]|nr:efflux RND transporter permease subunit [Candidatus Omnitrophota bacterium]